jgi:hypothetical protein
MLMLLNQLMRKFNGISVEAIRFIAELKNRHYTNAKISWELPKISVV